MNHADISWEMLNAYVDGELDVEESSAVARAVARDPELAQKVAALSNLRSAIAQSVDAPESGISAIPEPIQKRNAWIRPLLAASLAIVVAGGVVWATLNDDSPESPLLQAALESHQGWQPAPMTDPVADVGARVIKSGFAVEGATPHLPDLSPAKLKVAHVSSFQSGFAGTALLVGFVGTRGCRVSLITVSAQGDLDDRLTPLQAGGTTMFGWRIGALDYLIMSDGMDGARFELIAETVFKASQTRRPLGEDVRTALRENREKSPPCMG